MDVSLAAEPESPATRSATAATRDDRMRLVVLLGLLVGGLGLYRFHAVFHTLDDSWISFRAARNLVEHGVLTYDISRAPVEGMTNLLWALLSASWIALWPDTDPAVFARCLGAVLHLATLALVARIAARQAA